MHLRYTIYVLVILTLAEIWQHGVETLDCADFTVINGAVSYDVTPHTPGSIAYVTCDVGYALSTTTKVTCIAGKWNVIPLCLIAAPTLGGSCSQSSECAPIAHAECASLKCACVAGYFGTDGTTICIQAKIGASCADPMGPLCAQITNAACDATSKCKCNANYYGASGAKTCTKVKLEDDCTGTEKAKVCATIKDAECTGNKCTCKAGFSGIADTTSCVADSLTPTLPTTTPTPGNVCVKCAELKQRLCNITLPNIGSTGSTGTSSCDCNSGTIGVIISGQSLGKCTRANKTSCSTATSITTSPAPTTTSPAPTTTPSPTTKAAPTLGGSCSQSSECAPIAHAECASQKCACVTGYIGTDGTTTCVQVVLGFDCSFMNYFVCKQISNAECEAPSTFTCKCKPGYIGIPGTATCHQVTIDSDCSFNNYYNCKQIPNAACRVPGFLCKCQTGYTGTTGGTACVKQ